MKDFINWNKTISYNAFTHKQKHWFMIKFVPFSIDVYTFSRNLHFDKNV